MSGGKWDYRDSGACDEIFDMYPDYGKRGHSLAKKARERNPFKDEDISELVWDVFCLIHSADYCFSGDTGEEDYETDVDYFKNKWLRGEKK